MPKGQTPDVQGLQIRLESPVPLLYTVPEVFVPLVPAPRTMVPVVVSVVTEGVAVLSLTTIAMDDVPPEPPEPPESPEPPPNVISPLGVTPVVVFVTPKFLSQV